MTILVKETKHGRWVKFYNPITNESGLEWEWESLTILSKPVFIGTFPIRTDVPVLSYKNIKGKRFKPIDRMKFRIMGWQILGWKTN